MSVPPSFPLPSALQTWLWIRRPVEMMEAWSARCGTAYRLRLLPITINVFSDPDAVRAIFADRGDDMHAGEINRVLRAVIGEHSVLLLDGPEHMRHRKLLLPSFHGERMRVYGQTMADIARATIANWRVGSEFAIHPHAQEITLQIILRTVFGADAGAEFDALRAQIRRLLSVSDYRITFAVMIYLARRPELDSRAPWRYLLRERDRTDRMLYQTIAARRADARAGERKDVLALLMQARDEQGEPLTDRELRDELMTALVAGHETTATALAWAFERILSHPHVYGRLREELREAGGADASAERIAALPYLDATVKEVLRQRPVVPVVGRVLKKPIEIGGYALPKGEAVAASIYLAHRNPDVYPEPQQFRPERFLEKQPDPVSFLPFGGGIRRCIGAQFATYEMKVVLATMLALCDFELAERRPIRAVRRAVTLSPASGTRVRLVRSAFAP